MLHAGGDLTVVVGTPLSGGVADLGYRGHVDRMVELAVALGVDPRRAALLPWWVVVMAAVLGMAVVVMVVARYRQIVAAMRRAGY